LRDYSAPTGIAFKEHIRRRTDESILMLTQIGNVPQIIATMFPNLVCASRNRFFS
jgi:hypothetical protein